MTRRKTKPGDVFQITTPSGVAYLQYVCNNDEYGSLIRILPGIFREPLSSLRGLSQSDELYFVYFPVAAAVAKGLVTYVASEPLPPSAQITPPMRRAGGRSPTGRALNWWIVKPDGREELVDTLTAEQARYSLAAIWNDTMLIERICSEWRPEHET